MKCVPAILASALFGFTELASAQGFVNLDFESANLSPGTTLGSLISTNAGIPGWTAYSTQPPSGPQENAQIRYDAISLGGAAISINDANTGAGFAPLQGNFSAYLFGGSFQQSVSISQTGLVPATANSIQMEIGTGVYIQPIGPFTVSLNGLDITMVPLQTFSDYTLFGGNISSFANQTATLDITALPGNPNPVLLDNIQFSSGTVAEPSVISLLTLGAGIVGLWRRRKSAR